MKESSITLDDFPSRVCDLVMTKTIAEGICRQFATSGFNVTVDAVMHNYHAWLGDYKSGYRDDKNGYHLFTPCGCNPLRFDASELVDNADWQNTYEY